jgi:hypothetical protein
VIDLLEALLEGEVAGDPMTGLKWTRKTTRKLAAELGRRARIEISRTTVARLLKEQHYSLKVNAKNRATQRCPERNQQFAHIVALRRRCERVHLPIISVDTKKRELVGCFKNPGTAWRREPLAVNDHDFRTDALGVAIPYGIYDLANNQGAVFVGTSVDTPAFAVDSIERWWCLHGRLEYPEANTLVILADSGGSNGCAPRAWKVNLQEKLCNQHGLTVTVSHYPSGASKWNPIEHRLFSEISKHWAGQPLESYATILNYIRRTRTTTGLTARAYLVRKKYQRGVKISNGQMCLLSLRRNKTLPKWNYTLSP